MKIGAKEVFRLSSPVGTPVVEHSPRPLDSRYVVERRDYLEQREFGSISASGDNSIWNNPHQEAEVIELAILAAAPVTVTIKDNTGVQLSPAWILTSTVVGVVDRGFVLKSVRGLVINLSAAVQVTWQLTYRKLE